MPDADLRYVCHEEVTRRGQYEPCDREAVAMRDDPEGPYPVCARHVWGPMVSLAQHDREVAERVLQAIVDDQVDSYGVVLPDVREALNSFEVTR